MHRGRLLHTRNLSVSPFRPKVHHIHGESNASHCRPLRSILIANRGEIALRVGRTANKHGIETTAIYTGPDRSARHAVISPNAVNVESYLDGDRIVAAAKSHDCESIHPGYGFLSENSEFARSCVEAGLIFIGPPADAIEAMGNKSRSKEIMTAAGVKCIPGYHGPEQRPESLKKHAERIGFPVMLKAVKGGGGKGMRIATSVEDFHSQLESAKSEARSSFGDDTMLVERYIRTPRHIEVQVFADKYGNCVALGERDCSIQRRHQKILEESPAPNLNPAIRREIWEKARAAALAVGYEGAGTVEFIFDNESDEFFFMEMNTRLQVEHPVTEMVTGEDLVHWQILVAEGARLPLSQEELELKMAGRGHALEARIYAENTELGFIPDSGRLSHLVLPNLSDDIRVDAGVIAGDEVSAHYDSMIAKLIVRGPSRETAVNKLLLALQQYQIAGLATNISFLRKICTNSKFIAGDVDTRFIEKEGEMLFGKEMPNAELYAQSALAVFHSATARSDIPFTSLQSGFSEVPGRRSITLANLDTTGKSRHEARSVDLHSIGPGLFNIKVGDELFESVTCQWDSHTQTVRSFFPRKRLDSVVINDDGKLTVFQQGEEYHLQIATPVWMERAMGVKEAKNSVVAPMPCKILRVEVQPGDEVQKDQILVTIESMKMETAIRSPQAGRIARIVHRQGDMCKAGTALVEFEDASR